MMSKLSNKLTGYKESLWKKIENAGGIRAVLIVGLITLIAYPFIILYFIILEPLYKCISMLIEARKLGLKTSYEKQFYPKKYEKDLREQKEQELKKPLIPDGRHKRFEDVEKWPDAYTVDDMAVYGSKGRTLVYVDDRVEEFDVPEGVVNIYHHCFAKCDMLKRVSLPSSLKRIGKRAFSECVSLKEIVIPESVYVIDEEMFMNCSSLEHVVLPSQTTEISTRMFSNCRSLRYFSLPKLIKTIEVEAFRRCYSLKHIEMNDKLELVKVRAFEDCRSLKEFIMPESMRCFTEGMFNGCHSLQHIHFSSQIKDFGGSCCRDCWSIEEISMTHMDEKTYASFRKYWEKYGGKVDISKSECPYPESTFWTMENTLYFGIPRLTNVCLVFCFSKDTEFTIPSFVTNIKRDAFTSCQNLRTLRLSPYIKTSSDPWESDTISYGFIYEYWSQVENILFDETLKNTKYAFGLIA